jgi:hypothetical protein
VEGGQLGGEGLVLGFAEGVVVEAGGGGGGPAGAWVSKGLGRAACAGPEKRTRKADSKLQSRLK